LGKYVKPNVTDTHLPDELVTKIANQTATFSFPVEARAEKVNGIPHVIINVNYGSIFKGKVWKQFRDSPDSPPRRAEPSINNLNLIKWYERYEQKKKEFVSFQIQVAAKVAKLVKDALLKLGINPETIRVDAKWNPVGQVTGRGPWEIMEGDNLNIFIGYGTNGYKILNDLKLNNAHLNVAMKVLKSNFLEIMESFLFLGGYKFDDKRTKFYEVEYTINDKGEEILSYTLRIRSKQNKTTIEDILGGLGFQE
tara:strand:+ start:515 stop:1270 length:756 start_codon:yes stop_codon:yes gene_type:complete